MPYIEHQTAQPAYSGPELLDSIVQVKSVDVDIFGLDKIVLPVTSSLFPGGVPSEFTDFVVDAANPSFVQAIKELPSGVYAARYLDGAMLAFDDSRYNQRKYTEFSNGYSNKAASHTIWLRLGGDELDMHYLKDPAFTVDGYETAEEAEEAASNSITVFWHKGGGVEAIYDDHNSDYTENVGTITLRIAPYIPGVTPGSGYWSIVYSSLPNDADWPYILSSTRHLQQPTVLNIKPGLHILRYSLYTPGTTGNYQDFVLRAWNMPPRFAPAVFADARMNDIPENYRLSMLDGQGNMIAAPSLFPVKPKRITKGKGTPAVRGGTPLHQLPKYAGNEPERPESTNVYQRPQRLGDAEKY